jgi:ABC-type multidrug transport system fused ATPase/permease subunit
MDPVLAISTSLVFGSISVVLFLTLSKRATRLGGSAATATVISNNQIIEALSSFREIYVKNRQDYFASKIAQKRAQLSRLDAEIAFMPLISKYIFEISVISGALLVSAIQFYYRDALEAVSALAIFLVAGSRITPAVLRIQQNLLALKVNSSSAALTIELFSSLHDQNKIDFQKHEFPQLNDHSFEPEIKIENLRFKYSSESNFTLSVPSLTISPGEMTAIIGPSGSGKSTVVDLMLGVLTPIEGSIEISGIAPAELISRHPGVVAYVPQEIFVIDGSVRENVGFGHEREEIEDESIIEALKLSTLNTWVSQLPKGFDTPVGELGNRLSGGQRQRLGIARALLSKPTLLVLDEATSALDAISENEFVNSLKSLKGKVTLIVIAHRLSSVREADKVVYMDKGSVLAQGTFVEVRKSVPDFDTQANLMGL